jgi:adenylate cyclase
LCRLTQLNIMRAERGLDALCIGIGLSTGELIAGNVGAPRRMDFTVIGDTVNLSSRQEKATKYYGVDLIVSGQTHDALQCSYPGRELELIRVKGKDTPVAIHQIFATGQALPDAVLEAFALGRKRYVERAWDAAVLQFERVLQQVPDDTPSQRLLERCRRFRAEPPTADWDGVWPLGKE